MMPMREIEDTEGLAAMQETSQSKVIILDVHKKCREKPCKSSIMAVC